MNDLLFPDEALTVLLEARHDRQACRGFVRTPGAFLWSDELLHRVRDICSERNSRADVYLLAFRASLILGQPIEEYRCVWDQVREACPEWPGFRPSRCSDELAEPLERERLWASLLPESVTLLVGVLASICLLPFLLALPVGVHLSAMGFEYGFSRSFLLGAALQAVGILFWEIAFRIHAGLCSERVKWADHAGRGQEFFDLLLMRRGGVVCLQLFTVLLFAAILDGGVRFRACCYVYLLYSIPACLLLTLRWQAWSRTELLFLRWGWAPILALGIPLLLPILKDMGWIQVIR
jgi:hypothetical protein